MKEGIHNVFYAVNWRSQAFLPAEASTHSYPGTVKQIVLSDFSPKQYLTLEFEPMHSCVKSEFLLARPPLPQSTFLEIEKK